MLSNLFSDNFTEQNNILKDATLNIQRNIFRTNDSIIQISNISRIWIGKMIGRPYSIFHFILIFLGLFLFSMPSPFMLLIALGLIGLGGYYIYQIYNYNKENSHALHIEMNSGNRYILTSNDVDFLNRAGTFIAETINQYGLEKQGDHYFIDFSKHVIKNENGIVNTGTVGGDISNEK